MTDKLYTEDEIGAIVAKVLMNLDNRICSDGTRKESNVYRESYSYVDNQGHFQSIRFNGSSKKDTDQKFQMFLLNNVKKNDCPTLEQFVNDHKGIFTDGLSPTTVANYAYYLDGFILKYMGKIQMNLIDTPMIQKFYDWMACGGVHAPANKKSIDRIGGFAARIFSIAYELGVIESTPFKKKILQNHGAEAGHHKAVEDDITVSVKKQIPSLTDWREQVYMALLCYTGMRREEVFGLRWENVDLDMGYGVVTMTVVYPNGGNAVIRYTTKSKSSRRTFIIPIALKEILLPLQRDSGFVLYGKDYETPCSISTVKRTYASACKHLGISGINNHDWRATFATQMKETGFTSAQIADLMGHADTRMVETVYAPARHEGIMKYKDAIDSYNEQFARGNSVAEKSADEAL